MLRFSNIDWVLLESIGLDLKNGFSINIMLFFVLFFFTCEHFKLVVSSNTPSLAALRTQLNKNDTVT